MSESRFVLVPFKEFEPDKKRKEEYKLNKNIVICRLDNKLKEKFDKHFLEVLKKYSLESEEEYLNRLSLEYEFKAALLSTNYFLRYFLSKNETFEESEKEIRKIFRSIRIVKFIHNCGNLQFFINENSKNIIKSSRNAGVYSFNRTNNLIYPQDFINIKNTYTKIKASYSKNYKKENLLKTSLGLLERAHLTYDYITRFILLTTFLESLFNFDRDEVSFKISLRIANFIDKNNKKEIFKDIGDIYNIRSKFVHGKMPSKIAETERLTSKDNNLLKQLEIYSINIIRKIFKEEDWFNIYLNGNSDKLKEKFNELILE